MKFIFASDTHSMHEALKIPTCDFFIHSGDFTELGSDEETEDFIKWLGNSVDARYKIVIGGNHELSLESDMKKNQEYLRLFKENNIIYLQDSFVVLEGIKIYGSPWQPAFHDLAFNLPRNGKLLKHKWDSIPDNIDILVTHTPPYKIFDYTKSNWGCELLLNRVLKLKKLKLHSFGHVHNKNLKKINDVWFLNSSSQSNFGKFLEKEPLHIALYNKNDERFDFVESYDPESNEFYNSFLIES